ncbi:MAG: hypothetical protein M1151_05675 [Candidatus Thermoplasmatota archaeon]|jgi:predicted metalloprotease with PDZ domain|nr:hypothetical protein [Candidatus Thermoplasmatota archaeon]MCL5786137.1 hypothetical protein [Candidatus Thermoplasmatota archaeon]
MKISYFLEINRPETHYVKIRITIDDYPEDILQLTMPAWNPGSYAIRNFSRNVRGLTASSNGSNLETSKKDKSTWKIMTGRRTPIQVQYEVYAAENIPPASYVDHSRATINGTSVFLYPEGYREQTVEITISGPPTWTISTALDKISEGRYRATNYDILVDSPIEIGRQTMYSFKVDGKDHEVAVYGNDIEDRDKFIQDIQKIVEAYLRVMGPLPYRRYLFIIHLIRNYSMKYWGLEHTYSTVINFNSALVKDKEGYAILLDVVSHEFFHLWNVRRIRPAEFSAINFKEEVYTPSLWFSEGVTEYYASLALLRSGLISETEYLKVMADSIRTYELLPGRKYYSAAEASFDAWIRYYARGVANDNVNSYTSYYLKGLLIGMILNLRILGLTRGEKSLDTLLRLMMEKYRRDGRGFTEKELVQNLKEVTGADLTDLIQSLVRRRDDIDFVSELKAVGLDLKPVKNGEKRISTGLILRKSGENYFVNSVLEGTSAWESGLSPDDEIIAVGTTRFRETFTKKVMNGTLTADLTVDSVPPDSAGKIVYHVFRGEELLSFTIQASADPFFTYSLESVQDAPEPTVSLRKKFLYG